MAHLIDMSNDRPNIAYVGAVPWHGLGASMPDDASMDDWRQAAGFDWRILKSPALFTDETGIQRDVPDRLVFYRSDTGAPLSVMSNRYREVQPAQVLDFFADVCDSQRWRMETAGMLDGGRKYWALAKAGMDAYLNRTDRHELYMLLATSADGSVATMAQATDVRVVCNNTLSIAMQRDSGRKVSVRHNTIFDATAIKRELGMVDFDRSWTAFVEQMRVLQQVNVSETQARLFYSDLLRPADESLPIWRAANDPFTAPLRKANPERAIRGMDDLLASYRTASGSAPGTAYGLVQGVTHWLDHVRGPDQGRRISSAWFGQGARLKNTAFERALAMAA